MNNVKRLVFATNNAHKLEEARRIVGDGFEIVSLAEIGCHDDIPETADTLEGNALIKARWIKERYGYDCFSDDTGLMVDALGGAPGVYSARYAGENCTPADNVAKLLSEMKGIENRSAKFATVVALVADGEEHLFDGEVKGSIAHKEHGNGGFGYDPIFVAEETGICFAEMTPEAKNEISHRGRAMRKLRDFLASLACLLILFACGFRANAQQWRLHSAYDGQMERIIDTRDLTYFLGVSQRYDPQYKAASSFYGLLMRYDKNNDELEILGTEKGLSGDIVSAIEYNHDKKYLAIAYEDGNIDLLYDNGEVYNIPGLKLADSSMSKNVNSINVDNQNDLIYFSTDFGFITVNDSKKQVESSRVLGKSIKATASYEGNLWIATDDMIYYGNPKEMNFDSYKPVLELQMVNRMYPLEGRGITVIHGRPNNRGVQILQPKPDGVEPKVIAKGSCRGLEPMKSGLMISSGNAIQTLLPVSGGEWLRLPNHETRRSLAGTYDGKEIWLSSSREGITRLRIPEKEDENWTVLQDYFYPNVSSAFFCSAMAYSPEYGMLVRNHGLDENFNSDKVNYIETDDLVSAYKDMNWKRLSTVYLADTKAFKTIDPLGIAIDPNNPDHAYCGSVYSGILRLNLKDATQSIRIGKPSDRYGGYGEVGFAPLVPDPEEGAIWPERCLFSAPSFDASANMWSLYVNPTADNVEPDFNELWCWTAADRAASTSASNARPFKKIKIDGVSTSNNPRLMALKSDAYKNYLIFHGNHLGDPLIIYDHNGTISSKADDRIAKVMNIHDQDGSSVPFVYALCFYEDLNTGLVWVGTEQGLFTINPKEAFSNPSNVRRIKVARNDGTGLADYLLNGVQVNKIISDESGNKWFATGGAGLMCTTSDGATVLHSYTSENSPLRGDNVYSICLNPATNSIMASTDKGLCEIFLSGTAASAAGDVKVFPNPARPDFHGYVTIEGLPMDGLVKIVDTAGALVKVIGQASLGTAQWDLTNTAHRRVPAGVYFVVATNGPDSDSYTKMAKILVIE